MRARARKARPQALRTPHTQSTQQMQLTAVCVPGTRSALCSKSMYVYTEKQQESSVLATINLEMSHHFFLLYVMYLCT